MRLKLFVLSAFASLVTAEVDSSDSSPNPIVTLPYGSFRGQVVETTTQFLGMPFAAPPTGERRFGFPQSPLPFTGIRNATEFGPSCHQQAVKPPPNFPFQFPGSTQKASEDCLFINVVGPTNISKNKPLPVLFYLYGGAFQVGDSSTYPGNILVNRSLALGEPVIYVTANYRLNAFGFLGGKEVKDRGLTNVGMYDQRFALKWVQQNIAAFGGNPNQVTIWGESAGAVSVGLHMLFDDGNTHGLFCAAIMESGSPIRLQDVLEHQVYFDGLVSATNCTDAADRFECLKQAPFPALQSAVDASPGMFSYQSMNLAWKPMVDGTLIPRNPMQLVESGRIARVPFITGDCEDEGTLFALSTTNITTDAQFLEYVKSNYFPYITDAQMQALAAAYPDDVTQGSPFHTGTANAITPEYKRISALQGDMSFQAPRRFLLEVASKTQPVYSYRYLRGTSTPVLGAFHGSDIAYAFGLSNTTDFMFSDAIIYFARKHNPNPPADSISALRNTYWPKWSSSAQNALMPNVMDTALGLNTTLDTYPPLLTFIETAPGVTITSDTYRSDAIELMIRLRKQ